MTTKTKPFWDKILSLLKVFMQFLAILTIITNTYVVVVLITTDKFKIILNNTNVDGNIAITFALLVILLTTLHVYSILKNRLLALLANSFSISTALYIYNKCFGIYNDEGLIMKNKIFSVWHNYTENEKLTWIPIAESKFNISLTDFNSKDMSLFTSYREFENVILLYLAELEKQKAQNQEQEITQKNTYYSHLESMAEWLDNHKLLCLGVVLGVIVIGGVLYYYYKGSVINPSINKTNPEEHDFQVITNHNSSVDLNASLSPVQPEIPEPLVPFSKEFLLTNLMRPSMEWLTYKEKMIFLDSVFHGTDKDNWAPILTDDLLDQIHQWLETASKIRYQGFSYDYDLWSRVSRQFYAEQYYEQEEFAKLCNRVAKTCAELEQTLHQKSFNWEELAEI